MLDQKKFVLWQINCIYLTYAIIKPGVHTMWPVYNEMINIVNDKPVTFSHYKLTR